MRRTDAAAYADRFIWGVTNDPRIKTEGDIYVYCK